MAQSQCSSTTVCTYNWPNCHFRTHISVQSGDAAQGQGRLELAGAPQPPHVVEPKRVRLAPDVGRPVPNFRGRCAVGLGEPPWLAAAI